MILAIMAIVAVKNIFVWLAGQLGASLQEYVTRDLRDAVFQHMQRLSLRYFHRTKTGQIISKILSDTDQTKALIPTPVTRSVRRARSSPRRPGRDVVKLTPSVAIARRFYAARSCRRLRCGIAAAAARRRACSVKRQRHSAGQILRR